MCEGHYIDVHGADVHVDVHGADVHVDVHGAEVHSCREVLV